MYQFMPIALIAFCGALLPGPDFALVTKNTVLYQRRAGVFSALGIGSAVIIHMTYCLLGLGLVISQSLLLFSLIKYIGGAYLVYLGIKTFFSQSDPHMQTTEKSKKTLTAFQAWKQGFLCNLLNPKATLFFLAIFTVFIKPHTPVMIQIGYALELVFFPTLWFVILSFILSHRVVMRGLIKIQKWLAKVLGGLLIGFGIALAVLKHHA